MLIEVNFNQVRLQMYTMSIRRVIIRRYFLTVYIFIVQ